MAEACLIRVRVRVRARARVRVRVGARVRARVRRRGRLSRRAVAPGQCRRAPPRTSPAPSFRVRVGVGVR